MVFYKLKDFEVKKLMTDAIKKAGSERKLCKKLGVSKGTVYALKNEKRMISEIYLKKVLEFLKKEDFMTLIEKKFEKNYGRRLGGKNSVEARKKKGIYKKNLSKMHKNSSIKMKQWHKTMKSNSPEKYEEWKYKRFNKN